jgi:outer membrane lipoprotein-sorting protein
MKKKSTLLALAIFAFGFASAQSADEIVTNYFENTGGYDAWGKLEGLKMTAKVNQGGMEIPLEIVVLKDGKQYTKISLQGNEFMQGVFDGEVVWNTNFQSLTAEKADAETTANQKLEANDFPSDLYDYKDKGYTLELMGEETIEGTETFKLKLTKEPITVDGAEQDNVTFYYFDKENFVLLAEEQEIPAGPAKGMTGIVTFSDYDEVSGLYFPFSMSQGVKGGQTQPIKFETIEANPTVDAKVFAFPDGE